MKKILLIGDPHFKTSNSLESQQFVDEVKKYLENNHETLDFIVVLGDILDTHEKIHVQPLCRANLFLKMLSTFKKTYVLIGNHDRINNNVYMTEEHPFTSLKNANIDLVIVDKTYYEEEFCFVPYVPNGRFKEAIGELSEDTQCFFAHQEFEGCKMGGIISETGDKWEENNPPVFSGHIHDFQEPQKNIVYTGTPFQHNFSDIEEKGIFLLNFEDKEHWDIEKIELNIIKKRLETMNISDFEKYKVPTNCLLKINFTGETSLIKKILDKKSIKEKIKNHKITYKITVKNSKRIIKSSNSFGENLKRRIDNSDKNTKELFNEIFK